jgi:hypothetical protein
MTPREQVIVVLFGIVFSGLAIFCALDYLWEKWDDYNAREKTWRAIEVRSSMARHPSSQASVYDWAKEVTAE